LKVCASAANSGKNTEKLGVVYEFVLILSLFFVQRQLRSDDVLNGCGFDRLLFTELGLIVWSTKMGEGDTT
jgi:hypothetical protein